MRLISKRTRDSRCYFLARHAYAVIFRHLINILDVSSLFAETIITRPAKLSISFSASIYLLAYCAVFPFNGILIYDFIRRAGIYSICPDVSSEWQKKRGKKRNVKTKLVRGLSNRKVFPPLFVRKLVLPWRRSQLRSSAFGGWIEKEETEGKGTRLGETTPSFVITVQRYIFYSSVRERVAVESVGSNFSGLLAL